MSTISSERSTKLAELEAYCSGTPARQFSIPTENGITLIVNILAISVKGLDPTCHAPSNRDVNRAIIDLARCEPL